MNFKHLGLMLDCSRNAVLKVETVKKYIDLMKKLGFNTLMLYTEDTYEVDNQPYFGYLRGRYSKAEMKEIDAYALSQGVELIPCIQTLAHLNAIVRWREYHSCTDLNDILLIGDEKTYKLIDDMFSTLSQCVTSRSIHIGMDEAHMVGLGKYLDQHGYQNRSKILVEHLQKVCEIAKKYGFKPMMWSDMFFRLATGGGYYVDEVEFSDEVLSLVPENLELVYWDYYSEDKAHYEKMISHHRQFKNDMWFAGGLWCWNGFAPRNEFTIKSLKAAMPVMNEKCVENVFFTLWGDDGKECSNFAVLPSLYLTSCYAKGITDEQEIKDGFYKEFGIKFDDFLLLDLPDTCGLERGRKENPEKYMFYNDLFCGIFDCTIDENFEPTYDECADKLKAFKNHSEYGYLFDFYEKLCRFLQVKYTLGKRTREVYKSGDKKELAKFLIEYEDLYYKLEDFYESFKTLWFKENKPHGFDVQDIRIGGLKQRILSCRERLHDFVNDKIDSIPELEEEILNEFTEKYCYFNRYASNCTVNVFTHN